MRGTGFHCSSDKYYSENTINTLFEKNGFKKDQLIFWGAVPAGINILFYYFLYFIETIFEKCFLRKYLGGMTFIYKIKE